MRYAFSFMWSVGVGVGVGLWSHVHIIVKFKKGNIAMPNSRNSHVILSIQIICNVSCHDIFNSIPMCILELNLKRAILPCQIQEIPM